MAATQELLMGEGAGGAPKVYIEDVFSTYLYTGNGTSQTITNNIDLSTKGGMVWFKSRSNVLDHATFDTVSGTTLRPNSTGANTGYYPTYVGANSSGFYLNSVGDYFNTSGATMASWTFRKQPKFFDVVTYTGDGVNNRTISHNLGSTPGCIMVKKTSGASTYGWCVYHRSCSGTLNLMLNSTEAEGTTFNGEIKSPTSTTFTVSSLGDVNGSGATFVAYLFAHDAGGFGLTGTDNVISCGSFTTDGSGNATVSLGYEPQFLLTKKTNATSSWLIHDNMRALNMTSAALLYPNLSNAETIGGNPYVNPTPTGFNAVSGLYSASSTYIYIAIRRGPMKVPTDATKVFSPQAVTGRATGDTEVRGTGVTVTTGFDVDMVMNGPRTPTFYSQVVSRLTGANRNMRTSSTASESTSDVLYMDMSGAFEDCIWGDAGTNSLIEYAFKRAPSFFDVVCYTGTGSARTVTHNLAAAPQLLFVKARNNIQNWSALCTLNSGYQGRLNTTDSMGAPSAAVWGSGGVYVAPTSSVFTVGTDNETNASGWTYVAYLFATCPGVSKVGSYTGNGSTTGNSQDIDCGFAAGARFVMVKRNAAGYDWLVVDTARGLVSGDDAFLRLNTTAAEFSGDTINPYSAGFNVEWRYSSTDGANLNANGAQYIYLAIA